VDCILFFKLNLGLFAASLLFGAVLLLFPSNVMAAQVKLGWDKNSESNVAGYKVYCRLAHEDFNYDKPVWVGSANQCVVTNLEEETNYYFVVRAFTYSNNESEDSAEAEYDFGYDYQLSLDTGTDIDFGYEGNNYSSGLGGNGGADEGNGCFIGSVINRN
jgi:hypothetical protein